MTVYLCLIIWILIVWGTTRGGRIFVVSGSDKYHIRTNLFLAAVFFSSFLLMAARGESVGTDTAVYLTHLSEIAQLKWETFFSGGWDGQFCTSEKGFMVFEKILSYFTEKGQFLLVVCAAIYTGCMYRFLKHFSNHILTATVSFLCVGSYMLAMNVMRQCVAVGFCCIAWIHLQNKQHKKAALWILLACTFHRSSIIFFVTMLLKKIPVNRTLFAAAAAAAAVFSAWGSRIVYWVISFVPVYAARYGRGRWEISTANGIKILWFIIALLIIVLAFTTDWKNRENHIIFEIMLCSMAYLAINIVGQSFDGFDRLAIFFQPFLILLFEEGGKCFERKTSRVYYMGVTVCMALLFLRLSSTAQYQYTPFW
ncbi:EpsG family protein [Clostridiaceae bacterium]|nr:EpsG family protein [Clostridiaceae bacterium]